MKKLKLVLTVFCILSFNVLSFAGDIVWEEISRENSDLKCVLLGENSKIIYFGSTKGVFKSDDSGVNWRNVLSVRGNSKEVNFLSFEPQDKNSIYAATGSGLFISKNQARSWNRIFKGKNSLENECMALLILPSVICLGTKAGLFISTDKGRSWHKETGKIGNSRILNFACNFKEQDCIYAACVDGVFKSQDRGQTWIRIFIANPTENGQETEEISDDLDEAERFSGLRYIACDPANLNHLYLATSKGVYKSEDGGKSWNLLSDYGLLSRDTRFLLITNSYNIYASTKSGIFEYKDGRWYELSFRLLAQDIAFLASDMKSNLYVACEKGLYRGSISNKGDAMPEIYCKDEPDINKVQQAAIKYAEVEPEKISRWRKQAAKKALLPSVSAGVSRDTSDLWHWESGSTTKIDDDVLRRGRDNLDWDVRLTWDLGEIIWNDDQTSIDVRSRLMVQLRDDILDEVTKLYFERIRVKMEMDNLAIEDRKKRTEKDLRLQELTASLDALTGGYFSQQL